MYIFMYPSIHLSISLSLSLEMAIAQGETSAEHRRLQRCHGLLRLPVAPRLVAAERRARSAASAGVQTLGAF